MRQVARKSLVTAMAAGGMLAATAGYAHADTGAQGGALNASGIASGNNVQIPVHIPVNVCGNTVQAVGLFSSMTGSTAGSVCGQMQMLESQQMLEGQGTSAQSSSSSAAGSSGSAADGSSQSGGSLQGGSIGASGIASGNIVQTPVGVPVNVCSNSVNVLGDDTMTWDNECAQVVSHQGEQGNPGDSGTPEQPSVGEPQQPEGSATPDTSSAPGSGGGGGSETPQLAQTGASGSFALVIPASAGLLLGGVALYRRFRPTGG